MNTKSSTLPAATETIPRTTVTIDHGTLWRSLAQHVGHLFGVDRAVAYTVLARATQILGSIGTVLLILRFLTPIQQGYYYTLLSLVSLQAVFEMGFSFVILQMAAHECAHLTLHNGGRIEGPALSRVRLASILQKTLRWYLLASAILFAALLPLGTVFFSRQARASAATAWHGPWAVAVLTTTALFLLNPFFSFLEGCGQVWQVARMRLGQALLASAISWAALRAHHGLYAPAAVIVAYLIVGALFLGSRRHLLLTLLRMPVHGAAISWRREVWPFQWRIAVSWICGYFSIQIFTPMLFVYRGPSEAGQFGMSLGITTYLTVLMLAWISTKSTPFGQMIARGEFEKLQQLFSRTFGQAFRVMLAAAVACELLVIALQRPFPHLADRMLPPALFLLLLLASLASFVVQSMAIYLRSFKREPFLVPSIIVAALSTLFSLVTVKRFGAAGIALSYFACAGILGVLWAVAIFRASFPIGRVRACT
jgi:hypothetical protein